MDESEIGELYSLYERELHRFAQSLGHDSMDAQDLVHDTMVRALGSAGRLRVLPEGARRAWLYSTLRNLAVDAYRRRRRAAAMGDHAEPEASEDFPNRIAAEALLDHLEPSMRQAVHMRYWLRMNSREIAEVLGVAAPTVRYWLATARRILRRTLEDEQEE